MRAPITVYDPPAPIGITFLFAPGAGAGRASPFMVTYSRGLAARGVLVVTFDFPYMRAGRRAPDRNDVLEATFTDAIGRAPELRPENRLFIGGKSMGGRIASQIAAADGRGLAGVVALGYPLHPVGKPKVSRSAHLANLSVPMLFVHGTRDSFAKPRELLRIVRTLPKGSAIAVVDGGDHSLVVPKRGALTSAEVATRVEDVVAGWMWRAR